MCFLSLTVRADSLAQSPDWLALVHYRPTFFGFKSTIDSDNFFLAPDGKTNPSTELTETIRLFQSDDIKTQCRFPARYRFLKQNNLIQTPFPACPDYEQFKKDLNPIAWRCLYTGRLYEQSASLFGHTLMRIDIPKDALNWWHTAWITALLSIQMKRRLIRGFGTDRRIHGRFYRQTLLWCD